MTDVKPVEIHNIRHHGSVAIHGQQEATFLAHVVHDLEGRLAELAEVDPLRNLVGLDNAAHILGK